MTNWATALFEDVVIDETGGNIKTPQSGFALTGKYPIIDQGREFIAGYTDVATRLCKVVEPVVVFGDHTRALKYVDFPFCLGADGTKILRPKYGTDAKFLYHYLRTVQLPEAGYSRHYKFLKRLSVPTPPIDEQRRIAAILDGADALRAKRRAALAQLDEMAQAVFIEMFGDLRLNTSGWKSSQVLGDLAEVTSGITKGRKLPAVPVRSVPYLAVANVQDRALDLTNTKQIDASEDEIARYRLQPNDLVLTEGGDPDKLGRGVLWHSELPECIHQNHIFRVRLTSKCIHPLFLNWLVGSEHGKAYFLRSAKQTTGIASINMSQLRAFPLRVPPFPLQEIFVKRLDQLATLRLMTERSATKLDTLFASLQHRAFTGAL